jgi:hypothetical protein
VVTEQHAPGVRRHVGTAPLGRLHLGEERACVLLAGEIPPERLKFAGGCLVDEAHHANALLAVRPGAIISSLLEVVTALIP